MKTVFNLLKNHHSDHCHTKHRRDAHEPTRLSSQDMLWHIISAGSNRIHHLFLYRFYLCGFYRDSTALVRGHHELSFQMGTLISHLLNSIVSPVFFDRYHCRQRIKKMMKKFHCKILMPFSCSDTRLR